MIIRAETPADHAMIGTITAAAFANVPYSSQTEARIIEALRSAGALTLSLVASAEDGIVGHIAFSPVTLNGAAGNWFALGPVAVRPDRQGRGIGAALVKEGLANLRARGAAGCVLLGDVGYYGRFGFVATGTLTSPGLPADLLLSLAFGDARPDGTVGFHPGFEAE